MSTISKMQKKKTNVNINAMLKTFNYAYLVTLVVDS